MSGLLPVLILLAIPAVTLGTVRCLINQQNRRGADPAMNLIGAVQNPSGPVFVLQ